MRHKASIGTLQTASPAFWQVGKGLQFEEASWISRSKTARAPLTARRVQRRHIFMYGLAGPTNFDLTVTYSLSHVADSIVFRR
jgi:hypothetical protein